MLNLYLTPKSRHAPIPSEDAIQNAIKFLKDEGIIGPEVGPNEYSSGNHVSIFFHSDADQHFLPAELTFESWSINQVKAARFLPQDQDTSDFDETVCSVCQEPIDGHAFDSALDQLDFLPVNRVRYSCHCCQSEVPFAELDFGQVTAVARFWFFVEGVAWGRLNQALLDELGRILGFPLVIVPEVIQTRSESWRAQFDRVRQYG
ncbi:MAG: hypothetical protein VX589_20150 [Myxococcota bacterium]|nr:hypothetical protein [Myxococcota bacterium]